MNHVLKQFGFWSVHVGLTSIPSFLIARQTDFGELGHIHGMLLGILSFIILFTVITSSSRYQKRMKDSLIGKSLKLGAHIRMGLSFISIPLVVDINR